MLQGSSAPGEEVSRTAEVRVNRLLLSVIMDSPGAAPKRRRVERSPSPQYKLDDEDDSYEPYVPVAKRRQAKIAQLNSFGANAEKQRALVEKQEQEEKEDEEREEERLREKARKERTLLMEAQEVHERKAVEDAKKTEGERAEEADAAILAAIASRRKLASDLELAKGIQYGESLKASCVIFHLALFISSQL